MKNLIFLVMLFIGLPMLAQDFEELKRKAENGDMYQQYNLALWYYQGAPGVSKDYRQAFIWAEKSAKQGCDRAINLVGMMYNNGEGTSKDLKQAEYWFKKGVEMNDKYCKFNLGELYANEVIFQKYEEGIAILMEFAKQGDGPSMNAIANGYNHLGKNDLAIEWYTKAVEKGHLGAAIALGSLYLNGYNGFPIDIDKAIQWNNHVVNSQNGDEKGKNIARHNLPIAQYKKGESLYEQKKYREAKVLFMRAASNEFNPIPEAMNRLSQMYRYGLGEEGEKPDDKKAEYYAGEAAKHGDKKALEIWSLYQQKSLEEMNGDLNQAQNESEKEQTGGDNHYATSENDVNDDFGTSPYGVVTKLHLDLFMKSVKFLLTNKVKEGPLDLQFSEKQYDARHSVENFISRGEKTDLRRNGKLFKTITPTVNVHFVNVLTGKEKNSSFVAEKFYKYLDKNKMDVDSVAVTHTEVFLVNKIDILSTPIFLNKYREHIFWSIGLDIKGDEMTVTRTGSEAFTCDMGRGTNTLKEYKAQALFERIDLTIWHR